MEQVEEAVQKEFAKLKGRDKALLEKRNAVCMTCGWVGKKSDQYSNEQLSAIIQSVFERDELCSVLHLRPERS